MFNSIHFNCIVITLTFIRITNIGKFLGEKPCVSPVCNHRFTQSNSLKSHLIVHRDTDIVFKCKYCEIKYPNQKELAIHIKKAHKEKDVTETQEINEDLLNINDKPANLKLKN